MLNLRRKHVINVKFSLMQKLGEKRTRLSKAHQKSVKEMCVRDFFVKINVKLTTTYQIQHMQPAASTLKKTARTVLYNVDCITIYINIH